MVSFTRATCAERPSRQDDPKYRELLRIRNPKTRLRKFVDACRSKQECPETGQPQPSFRMEG
jgi:DNA-directed RNA polymerase II subunit RPB1